MDAYTGIYLTHRNDPEVMANISGLVRTVLNGTLWSSGRGNEVRGVQVILQPRRVFTVVNQNLPAHLDICYDQKGINHLLPGVVEDATDGPVLAQVNLRTEYTKRFRMPTLGGHFPFFTKETSFNAETLHGLLIYELSCVENLDLWWSSAMVGGGVHHGRSNLTELMKMPYDHIAPLYHATRAENPSPNFVVV